jgi:hypothetical protein
LKDDFFRKIDTWGDKENDQEFNEKADEDNIEHRSDKSVKAQETE